MQTIYFYMISISILDNLQACMYLLAFFMIYYQFRAISSENQCLGYACSPHAEMPPLQFYRNRVFVYIVCLVYCFFFLFIYLFSILLNKLFSFLSFFSLGFITYPQIILLIFSMKRLCSLLLPVTRWLSPIYCACHCPDFPPVWLLLRRTAPPSEGYTIPPPGDPDSSLSCVSLGFECVVLLGIDTVCAQEYPPPHCRVCTFLYHGASDQKVNLYRRRGGVQEKVSPGLLRPVTGAEDV